jgi:hypothetical protein
MCRGFYALECSRFKDFGALLLHTCTGSIPRILLLKLLSQFILHSMSAANYTVAASRPCMYVGGAPQNDILGGGGGFATP